MKKNTFSRRDYFSLSNSLMTVFLVSHASASNFQKNESSCDAATVNKAASCLSQVTDFFSTERLGVLAGVGTTAAAAQGVVAIRKSISNYLLKYRDELVMVAAQQGQIDWAIDWAKQAKGERADEAAKEIQKLKELRAKGVEVIGAGPSVKYPPRIKEVNGIFYDIANIADNDIGKLPMKFHADNIRSAEISLDQAIEQLRGGRSLDQAWRMATGDKIHRVWLANNPWAASDPVQGKTFKEMLEMAKSSPDPALRAKAIANVELDLNRVTSASKGIARQIGTRGATALVAETAGKALTTPGARALLLGLAGVTGDALLAVDLGGDTPFNPSACYARDAKGGDEINGLSGLRVRDVINSNFERNCYPSQPTISADAKVLNFLASSDEDKNLAMKNQKVCDFYKKLSATSCPREKVSSHQCIGNPAGSARVAMSDPNGGFPKYIRIDFGPTGNISAIRGSTMDGYTKRGDEWIPFAVPVSLRRYNQVPDQSWIAYDGKDSKMPARQQKLWNTFMANEGVNIGANLNKLEEIATQCSGTGPSTSLTSARPIR